MMNPLKVIESESEYRTVQLKVSELTAQELEPHSEQYNEVKLLLLLIEDYQKRNVFIDEPDPIDYIKVRMEELGLEPKDLVKFIGDRSTVTKILNRKRELTVSMMRGLHKGLAIPAEVFL